MTPTSPNVQRARRALLSGLLALSLVANAVFAWLWIREVQAGHAARLDPAGLEIYAAPRASPPADGRPVLVLFGDSRALMWPTPADLPEYAVVNRGVGFQTTAQIAMRLDADVASLHPSVVVLEAGVNDLKTIAELPERRAKIVADCEANLRAIVERLRGMAAHVVVMSVFDFGDVPVWRRPFWSEDVAAAVREVNAFLPSLAGDRVTLVDSAALLDDERGKVRRQFQADYIHENPAAYAALDTKVLPLVRGMLTR